MRDEKVYVRNESNLALHELTGLMVRVINSSDRHQIGISGTVLIETKNTLLVLTSKGAKRTLIKRSSVFEFSVDGRRCLIDGNVIGFRPHERIERCIRLYGKSDG